VAQFDDTPILAGLIADLAERRRLATAEAVRVRGRLADVEALHEPDADRECPTCRVAAPCPTLRLARGEIDYETACSAVRGFIDLTALEPRPGQGRPMPSIAELLSTGEETMDRFFDALLGNRTT
jgi:hypothetical protein